MKLLVLQRDESGDQGTFGRLTELGTGKRWATAELPWRNNARNISCIPRGVYKMQFMERSSSGRFRNVYWLRSVPGRGGILIHVGNWAGDVAKGYRSDVNGCILVGTRRGVIAGQKVVLASRVALRDLVNVLNKEPAMLWVY